MTMTPHVRKVALTAHITSSVGWLGAVAGFLALAIAGLTSRNDQVVRGAYLAMQVTAWCVIVPLSFASPITGLVQSLGTAWGLFRHYWVLAKFLITVPATLVLLLHLQPIGHMADAVARATLSRGDLAGLRIQLVASSAAAVVVLLVATTLSVFKPWGMTRYGRRKQFEQGTDPKTASFLAKPGLESSTSTPRLVKAFWFIVIVIVLLFVILHLAGLGLGHHIH